MSLSPSLPMVNSPDGTRRMGMLLESVISIGNEVGVEACVSVDIGKRVVLGTEQELSQETIGKRPKMNNNLRERCVSGI
jgi:hypothetical protein